MTADLETLRCDKEAMLAVLREAGATITNPACFACPFHEDRNPSATVYETQGVWRFKCHAGSCGVSGDVFDMQARIAGRPLEDILKEASPTIPRNGRLHKPQPRPEVKSRPKPEKRVFPSVEDLILTVTGFEKQFVYSDPKTGKPELIVLRLRKPDGKKSFLQVRPEGEGFVFGSPPKPLPIYNRTRLAQAIEVFVVEGEKCVHALHNLGFVATTSPGGAGKAGYADWGPLAGKRCLLWPDNDPPGKRHMRDVQEILERLIPKPDIRLIEVDSLALPEKGDVADLTNTVESYTDRRKLIEDVLKQARGTGPYEDLGSVLEDTISGKRSAIPFPWPKVSEFTNALLPGTVTIIAGDPGATKSFFLLECLTYWHLQAVPVACYQLEEERSHHLNRVLAQLEGDSGLTDPTYIKANPDLARAALEKHKDFLESFGQVLHESPNPVSMTDLAKWVGERAAAGSRIIAIDPISAGDQGKEPPWVSDRRFFNEVRNPLQEHGASLVLITHSKKGRKGSLGLDEIAGGAAFQRFSQCVLWLERVESGSLQCDVGAGFRPCKVNRKLHISKSRNGRGAGKVLGFHFNGGSLTFEEHGEIERKKGRASEDE